MFVYCKAGERMIYELVNICPIKGAPSRDNLTWLCGGYADAVGAWYLCEVYTGDVMPAHMFDIGMN